MQSPYPTEAAPPAADSDAALTAALDRIAKLTAVGTATATPPSRKPAAPHDQDTFMPIEPASFRAAGLTDSEVEALILKFLLARGDAAGRDIAEQVKLPFVPVGQLLSEMKYSQLVGHRGSAPMNDFRVPA